MTRTGWVAATSLSQVRKRFCDTIIFALSSPPSYSPSSPTKPSASMKCTRTRLLLDSSTYRLASGPSESDCHSTLPYFQLAEHPIAFQLGSSGLVTTHIGWLIPLPPITTETACRDMSRHRSPLRSILWSHVSCTLISGSSSDA